MADQEPPLLVEIEYCSSCGFRARAVELQEKLDAAFGAAIDVEIGAGRPKSFEVKAGGELLHSKLDSKKWPEHADVMEAVRERLGARGDAAAAAVEAERKRAAEEKDAADANALTPAAADELVQRLVAQNEVVVFSKTYCPYCRKAKESLKGAEQPFYVLELDQNPSGEAIQAALERATGQKTVPNVFVNGKSIGGGDDTARMVASGELAALLRAGRPGAADGHVAVEMGELKNRGAAAAAAAASAAAAVDAGDLPPKQCLPLALRWPLFFFPYNLNVAVARTAAIFNVVLCVVAAVFADEVWARYLTAAVAGDFFLRVIFGGRGSVLGTLATLVAHYLPHSMTPGPPKQFAQMIGFSMSGAATLFLWLDQGRTDYETVARVLLGVLAFFAALEGFANFCAGCWMFGLAVNFGVIKVDPSIRCDKVAAEQHHTLDWIKGRLLQPPPREVVAFAGPGKVPLIYKQKNDDHKKEDFDLVRHAHIHFGGLHMGLAGVAMMFKVADAAPGWNVRRGYWVGTGVFAATVYCAWLALFLLKALLHPRKVVKEWHHPVQSNFFAGNLLVPVIYSFLVADEKKDLALGLFWVFAPLLLAVSLALMARWMRQYHYRGLLQPVWMVPPVGNLVAAIVAPFVGAQHGHDYVEAAYLWYSIGLVMWIVLITMTMQRVFFGNFVKDQMRGTLFILVASPAAACLAHLAVNGTLGRILGGDPTAQFDEVALVLFFFGINMALLVTLLGATAYIGRYRYEVSYWALVFPTAALAIAAIVYDVSRGSSFTGGIAVTLMVCTLAAAVINLAHTLVALAERRLFTPQIKFGPMAFFSKLSHYAMRDGLRQMNLLSRKLHRPEKLEEFARAYFAYLFVHDMHADFEETVLFPEISKFFRGLTDGHEDEHAKSHADERSMAALLDELVPGAREDALAAFNYYKSPAACEAAKREARGLAEGAEMPAPRAPTKVEINRLVELGHRIEEDANEHFNSEEMNIGHFLTKYFNAKLGKKVAAGIWNKYDSNSWRVYVPYVVQHQDLHGRRLKALKSLQMVLPERMHQVGHYVYEAVDDVMWDRVSVDVPEMIPRHVQGHHRIF